MISKDDNVNSASNTIFVSLSDGTNTAAISAGGAVSVSLASGLYAEDSAHVSGDVGFQALTVRKDTAVALAGTDGDYAPLQTDENGKLYVTLDGESLNTTGGLADDSAFTVGTSLVSAIGALADETAPDSVNEGDVGAVRMTLDRKLLTRVVGASDANRLDIDASGHAQVDLAAVSVTAVPISANGTANSETNPVYVYVTDQDGATSTEVHNQNTATVASLGTTNHDYTVAGSYFMAKKVAAGSSGGCKIEVKAGPLASLVTYNVAFIPLGQGGYVEMNFAPYLRVPSTSTGTFRVAKTNLQGSSNDIYSTIMGNDYA